MADRRSNRNTLSLAGRATTVSIPVGEAAIVSSAPIDFGPFQFYDILTNEYVDHAIHEHYVNDGGDIFGTKIEIITNHVFNGRLYIDSGSIVPEQCRWHIT